MARLLDAKDKTCAKLQELADTKDVDQVINAADFTSKDDSIADLQTGFNAGIKASKGKGNAYLLDLDSGTGVIFIGRAEDIRKKLEKLDKDTDGEEEDDDDLVDEGEDEDEEEEDDEDDEEEEDEDDDDEDEGSDACDDD